MLVELNNAQMKAVIDSDQLFDTYSASYRISMDFRGACTGKPLREINTCTKDLTAKEMPSH